MLDVLLESKAVRTRRVGGTLASMLVHGAGIAAAVTLTVRQTPGLAGTPAAPPKITYIRVHDARPIAPPVARPTRSASSPVSTTVAPRPVIQFVSPNVPNIEVPATHTIGSDDFLPGRGLPTSGPFGGSVGVGGPTNGVIEERYVDRAPRMLGSPVHPEFP